MIEPDLPGAFITKSPDEAYKNGEVVRIPWISTVTSEESNTIIAEIAARGAVPILNRIFDVDAPALLGLRGKIPLIKEEALIHRIRKFYGVEETSSNNNGFRGRRTFFMPRQFFTEVS